MKISATKRKFLGWAGLIYPAMLLLVVTPLQVFFPQPKTPLAFFQVFAPYLWLPLLGLIPLLFLREARWLRWLMLACAVVWLLRFGPDLNFFPPQPTPGAFQVDIVTWNIYIDNPRRDEVRKYIYSRPASLIAMQETNGDWLEGDATIARLYPYQYHIGHAPIRGLVLLSVYPILESYPPPTQYIDSGDLKLMWVKLDLGQGRTLTVINIHPVIPQVWRVSCNKPFCYDSTNRDRELTEIRGFVDQFLQKGEPFVLVGDFNTTEREPAFKEVSSGLQDIQKKVGVGWGLSWGRLWKLEKLIKLDHQFSSPTVTPLTTSVDCTYRGSDHCLVYGKYELK